MKYRFSQHEPRKTISLPFPFLTVNEGNYVSIVMKLTRDQRQVRGDSQREADTRQEQRRESETSLVRVRGQRGKRE